jgi:hypothetical protein
MESQKAKQSQSKGNINQEAKEANQQKPNYKKNNKENKNNSNKIKSKRK